MEIDGSTDVVVYKIDKSGDLLWGKEGILVSAPGYREWDLRVDVNENNEIIIAYVSYISEMKVSKIFIHKIKPDGTKAWASEGVVIGDSVYSYNDPQISILPNGEVLIAYLKELEEYYTGEIEILANKISPNGNLMWDRDL